MIPELQELRHSGNVAIEDSANDISLRVYKKYLFFLGVILIGYAFFGKGFAYIGIPPIYIGEISLLLGVLVFFNLDKWFIFRLPVTWILALYMTIGAIVSWNSFREGWPPVDTARDSVIWVYGFFAIIVSTLLVRLKSFEILTSWYARWFIYLIIWIPFDQLLREPLKGININGVDFLHLLAQDASIQLVGAFFFWILFLNPEKPSFLTSCIFWVFWVGGFLYTTTVSRASGIGIILPIFLLFVTKAKVRPRILAGVVALILVLSVMVASNLKIETTRGRSISAAQLAEHVESTFSDTSNSSAQEGRNEAYSTKIWRERWWDKIIDYTFNGDYFWQGKGFGINLADSDGFQVFKGADRSLRSPHNGHMTVLARMGVPGYLIWLMFLLTLFVSLFRSYLIARSRRNEFIANLHLWIFAYLIANLIQTTFTVMLEGPHGGIWFWSSVGVAIALIYHTKYRLSQESQ